MPENRDQITTLADDQSGLRIEELKALLVEKDKKIKQLENDLAFEKERKKNVTTGLDIWQTPYAQGEVNREIKIAQENGEDITIYMLDMDFLHHLNKKYTHRVADEALQAVPESVKEALQEVQKIISESLNESLRNTDLIYSRGTQGADEFIGILRGVKSGQIPIIAIRIQETFDKKIKERVKSAKIPQEMADEVSFSGGFAQAKYEVIGPNRRKGGVESRSYEDIEETVSRAESLLYTAKSNGRNILKIEGDPVNYSSRNTIKRDTQKLIHSTPEYEARYDYSSY